MNAPRRLPLLETTIALAAFVVLVVLSVARENGQPGAQGDTFSSFDTRSGGYRAWYELLAREGITVERFERRPAFLEGSVATLISAEPLEFVLETSGAPGLTPADAEALERWTRGGGRLVLLGNGDLSSLIAGDVRLAHWVREVRTVRLAFVSPSLRAFGVERLGAAGSRRLLLNGRVQPLVADRHGALVVRVPYGKGEVIQVADQSIFTNATIATPDRARLAFALAAMQPLRTGTIAFDESRHGYFVPEHWWAVMPAPLMWSLALTCLAVAIAVIGGAIRLGPALSPPTRREPTSSEYIDALAELYARAHATRKAIGDAYASARLAATRALDLASDAADREIGARLPEPANAEFAELGSLARGGAADSATLVRSVTLAYRIRREMERGGV